MSSLKVIQTDFEYRTTRFDKNNPEYIIVHHALAKHCTAEDIHRWHLDNGWFGFGYHYFINKQGQVFQGRLDEWNGSHCKEYNMNFNSIGICLEGCYQDYGNQTDLKVPQEQLAALIELVGFLMQKHSVPVHKVKPHRYFAPYKECPGTYFPWDEFIERVRSGVEMTVEDFQKRYGLVVDGIVGPKTRAKMEAVFSFLSDFVGGVSNKPTIALKMKYGIKYVELDPFRMESVDTKEYASNLVKKYPNFTGGMFSHPKGRLINLLVVNSKKVYAPKWYDIGNKGTFIAYNSGQIEVISTKDIDDTDGIKLAFQGFNLNYEVNGSDSLYDSIIKEFWNPDVYRKCYRVGWGYNYKNRIVIAALINGTAEDLRQAMRKLGCIDYKNNTCGIGVDAGKKTACAVNGQLVHDGENGWGEPLEHILTF